jgi:hypothetical protein
MKGSLMSIIKNATIMVFDARAITGLVSADDSADESFTSRGVRYLDPKELNTFAAIRQSTHTALVRMGTRFLNGYAVSNDKAEKAAALLAEKAAQWEAEKSRIVMNYDRLKEEWAAAHPEVQAFQDRFPSLTWVNSRIGFEWTSIQIAPTQEGERGLAAMVGELPAQIIEEVAADVAKSWTPSAQRMNARTRGIIERVADKLESLSFLGGKLGPMAARLREVLASLPKEGTFAPQEAALAGMVLAMLSSPRSAADLLTLDPAGIMTPGPKSAETAAPVFAFDDAAEEVSAPAPVPAPAPAPVVAAEEDDFFFSM